MFRFRKVLSVLLSFTLVFSLVGLPAYADEYGQEEETEQDGSVVQIADEQRISNAGNELSPMTKSLLAGSKNLLSPCRMNPRL